MADPNGAPDAKEKLNPSGESVVQKESGLAPGAADVFKNAAKDAAEQSPRTAEQEAEDAARLISELSNIPAQPVAGDQVAKKEAAADIAGLVGQMADSQKTTEEAKSQVNEDIEGESRALSKEAASIVGRFRDVIQLVQDFDRADGNQLAPFEAGKAKWQETASALQKAKEELRRNQETMRALFKTMRELDAATAALPEGAEKKSVAEELASIKILIAEVFSAKMGKTPDDANIPPPSDANVEALFDKMFAAPPIDLESPMQGIDANSSLADIAKAADAMSNAISEIVARQKKFTKGSADYAFFEVRLEKARAGLSTLEDLEAQKKEEEKKKAATPASPATPPTVPAAQPAAASATTEKPKDLTAAQAGDNFSFKLVGTEQPITNETVTIGTEGSASPDAIATVDFLPEQPPELDRVKEIIDPATGEVNLTPEAQQRIIGNENFRAFLTRIPDIKERVAKLGTPEGQKWQQQQMENFVRKVYAFEQLKGVYKGEIAQRLGVKLADGDFEDLKGVVDAMALREPKKILEFLAQLHAHQTSVEARAQVQQKIDELAAQHLPAAELQRQIEQKKQEAAKLSRESLALRSKERDLRTRAEMLSHAVSANKKAGFFRNRLVNLTFRGEQVFGEAMTTDQDAYTRWLKEQTGHEMLPRDFKRFQAENAAELERFQAANPYQANDAAIANLKQEIVELEKTVKSIETATAAKSKIEALATNARAMLLTEANLFRDIAEKAAQDFDIELISGTAIAKGPDGKPLPGTEELMTKQERVQRMIQAESRFTPEWVKSLDAGLTEEADRALAAKLLNEEMVGLKAALNDPENKKPTPELLAHFLALGQAINTLGGVRAEKIAAAAVGKQEALTPEQEQEARVLNEVENANKILQKQLEFLMQGSRSQPGAAATPWNLKQAKDFQSVFVTALEGRKRAHEKLKDAEAVKRDEAGIAAITALFKKLDQVEALKQRAVAVGVAVPKTIDLPPPGFLEEAKDLIESLNT